MLQVFGLHEVWQAVSNVIKELPKKRGWLGCVLQAGAPAHQQHSSALPQLRSPAWPPWVWGKTCSPAGCSASHRQTPSPGGHGTGSHPGPQQGTPPSLQHKRATITGDGHKVWLWCQADGHSPGPSLSHSLSCPIPADPYPMGLGERLRAGNPKWGYQISPFSLLQHS